MAYDQFIKLDGIPGESGDDKHKDWIEVLSYNWGVAQPSGGARSTGGAASSGRVDVHDFSIVHVLDKASPKLFLSCCKGEHIKNVTMELCLATGDKQKYMEYKMTDVLITSVRPGGAAQGGEPRPLEEVSLNFGKIELGYTVTNKKTGKPEGDVKSNWDMVANKGA
jgi:type VI secretion system secreted protein Hcp